MISKVTFITGNKGKFEEASRIFANSGIELLQQAFDTPEIQSDNAGEIAKFSAKFVGDKLNMPLFVMDRGLFIEGLNGFPGPFIKYINKWLNPQQVLGLLSGIENRKAYWVTAIGLFLPNQEVKVFESKDAGTIVKEIVGDLGYMADKLFIPDGQSVALSQMPKDQYDNFWESSSCWVELISYLKNNPGA